MANRDNADPSGLGNTLGWAWAWPLNRRVLYNRASADINGKPWDPKTDADPVERHEVGWQRYPGLQHRRTGQQHRAVLSCSRKGLGRLFAIDKLAEGPFPETLRANGKRPLGTNPLQPPTWSPVRWYVFYQEDAVRMGKKDKFPYVGTTYRLTEHFHTWTKHARLNAIAQPEQFVEISETLAKAKASLTAIVSRFSSQRGFIRAVAVVTRRLQALNVHGQQVEPSGSRCTGL
ncbi:Formate dehydrogenase, nitrate-inducible, major subunit precursor [Leclercia adecarboxylata]|uniref:Formate dehydrogenase, nitrate-inducible, major subunit n=1 Tax=Leclercia adecarboxylata TaxID=83655 RepID=A0A4U9HWR6_9ENTR|nr:Formate dehydrogenase, nitrate-inducible, major subunit precursor [Leclercia adecarboxylata]